MSLQFPSIDPIAVQIGPLAVHWYALAYFFGIFLGWRYAVYLSQKHLPHLTREIWDDVIFWATMGVVLGGRLGYVIFYKPVFYLEHPAQIFMLWQGGMSFHGGFLGVLIAAVLFAKKRGLNKWNILDVGACVTPIGLFLGRVANFINGELYGRPTDAPWGMVFPNGGDLPRHPSQLYEAGLEGVAMLIAFFILQRRTSMLQSPGLASGLFLIFYAASRMFVEIFREPDSFLGLLQLGLTMGQWLCVPMMAFGIALVAYARKKSLS